jgi:hypothetical protein
MTFHDETSNSAETLARKNARQIMVWLGTIAPVGSAVSQGVRYELLGLAKELGWGTEEDDMLGEVIK